ncbi:MAG: hypothetical protein IKO39_06135 [Treponema sp.]|nr:hypothetical protein [Treponema sp.]
MNKPYYLYKKTTENIEDLLQMMNYYGFPLIYCHSAVDSNRDFMNYKELKKIILQNEGLLFIKSLHTIGDTKETILEELKWFKETKSELVIMELPSTWVFDNKEKNIQNINVLYDVFSILQRYEGFEFQNPEFFEGGRKKIRFPENWEILYEKYAAKEITANDFQKMSGLKRATFYNLLCEYKELLRLNQSEHEERELWQNSNQTILN